MKKKLVSLLLAGSVVASMAAIASVSASAIIDENGCYAPGENVESTHRYYLAMPKEWYSSNTDTAGVYWWSGTDACGAVDGTGGTLAWPGYKAQRSEVEDVYYIDCPTDVTTIVWNNYINGGTDKEAPVYLEAKQAANAGVEYYSDGDSDLYDSDWFIEMEESFDGDKAALGDFADNFFIEEEYGFGLSFNFDNMIYVIDLAKTDVNFEGKMTYVGDWYFYYGNGEYGTYPTKEESVEKGTYKVINEKPATGEEPGDNPATGEEPVEPSTTVEVPTTNPNPSVDPYDTSKPTSSTDPTSSTKAGATSDTPGSSSNGAVQTGNTGFATILLVLLATASGFVAFARKKHN